MPEPEFPQSTGDPVRTDSAQADLGFGDGGVPWYLLLLYLGFLSWFTWYVLEFQLPDFQEQGPIHIEEGGAQGG